MRIFETQFLTFNLFNLRLLLKLHLHLKDILVLVYFQECDNYMILDDSTRNVDHGVEPYCDEIGKDTSPDWKVTIIRSATSSLNI